MLWLVLARGLYGALFVSSRMVAISDSTGPRPRSLHTRGHSSRISRSPRTLMVRSFGQDPAQLVLLRWRPGEDKIV
jgi:hypothetical protein